MFLKSDVNKLLISLTTLHLEHRALYEEKGISHGSIREIFFGYPRTAVCFSCQRVQISVERPTRYTCTYKIWSWWSCDGRNRRIFSPLFHDLWNNLTQVPPARQSFPVESTAQSLKEPSSTLKQKIRF